MKKTSGESLTIVLFLLTFLYVLQVVYPSESGIFVTSKHYFIKPKIVLGEVDEA